MSSSRFRQVGNVALILSFLMFAIYFANVVTGGPLGKQPWMGDVAEMLTLFIAVIFFVFGTLAREEEAGFRNREERSSEGNGNP